MTWNPRSFPPACDLCEAEDDVQDEQRVIFHCTHPHVVSLHRRFASLSSEIRVTYLPFCTRTTTNTIFSHLSYMNKIVDSNSNTLHDVMKADISLGNSGAFNCWTRKMKDAFGVS